jgi:hypothetical protein
MHRRRLQQQLPLHLLSAHLVLSALQFRRGSQLECGETLPSGNGIYLKKQKIAETKFTTQGKSKITAIYLCQTALILPKKGENQKSFFIS